MISKDKLLNFLGHLFECAREGSAEAWQDVYLQMADMFSSGPGGLAVLSPDDGPVEFIASTVSEEGQRAFNTKYRYVNPLRKYILQTAVGETFSRVRDYPDREFLNTEYYQDFLRKENVYEIRYTKLCDHAGRLAGITFSRPRSRPRFSKDKLEAMEFLIPYLRRAVQIHLDLSNFRSRGDHLSEVMNKRPQGAILLDRSAKIVFCTETAENILMAKDGLEIDRNSCLLATWPQDNGQLKMNLNSVVDHDGEAFKGGFMQISRPSGKRPYHLHVLPLSQQNFGGYSPDKLALLCIFDPEQRVEAAEEPMRRMYGLTPTESRLVGLLTKGTSLQEAGDLLHIQSSTVHTHMKHIFAKTDCKRQGELIMVILNGLAGIKDH